MRSGRKRKYARSEWPKVQTVTIRGQIRFKVDGRPHKERLFFKDLNDALVQADVWARERRNQGLESLEFPTALRIQAEEAAILLAPFGKSLTDAAHHYVAHLKSEAAKQSANTVATCIDEWLKSKRAEAKSNLIARRTIQELEGRATLFKSAFGTQRISEISEDEIKTFLDALPISQRTRQNLKTKLVQFFNFCRRKDWVTSNPASAIKIKVPALDVEILTPAQAETLLAATLSDSQEPSLTPYVAVCLFAGLRPGEAEQLRWEHIHLETGQIEIRGETSKTRESRFVKIESPLHSWLKPYRRPQGLIIGPNYRRRWEAVRSRAGYRFRGCSNGVRWHPDVMRHSFGSYWLALHADRPRLAEEMGNTVEVIKAHYKRAIPRHVAEKFWALEPVAIGSQMQKSDCDARE